MKRKKCIGYDGFDIFYRLSALFAMYLLPVSFFVPYIVHSRMICVFISLACFAWGYASSLLCSRVNNIAKGRKGYALKSDKLRFEFAKAILPLLISIVFSVLVSVIQFGRLDGIYNGIYSGLIMMLVPLNILSAVLGCVLYFYPIGLIANERVSFVGACIIMVSYIFNSFSDVGEGRICLVFLALYVVSSVTALSYANTVRSYSESTVESISKRVKANCLRTTAIFTGISIMCFVVLASLFSGVTVIFKGILANALVRRSHDEYAYEGAELYRQVNKFVYGTERAADSPLFYFYIIFLILVFIGLFLLFFGRIPEVKHFFRRIKEKIINLLQLFCDLFKKRKKESHEYSVTYESYRDHEKKLVRSIRDYSFGNIRVAKSFKSFEYELEKCADEREKLRYSYVTLIGILRKQPLFIKKGDSPSEISAKLCSRAGFENIEKITHVYEECAYSDKAPSKDGTRSAITDICYIIKKYME